MKVAIGGDHRGFDKKKQIQDHLKNFDWIDVGPNSTDSVDYPDYSEKVARLVAKGEAEKGILICGSGIGVCIAANKIKGIRAALVENVEQAKGTRLHNDSNVLCLAADLRTEEETLKITEAWLETSFSNEDRHKRRIHKITQLEGSK